MADEHSEKSSVLIAAAKALGSAAGKIASLGKHEGPTTPAESAKAAPTKFQRHTKSRLPRKLKKKQKKEAARKA